MMNPAEGPIVDYPVTPDVARTPEVAWSPEAAWAPEAEQREGARYPSPYDWNASTGYFPPECCRAPARPRLGWNAPTGYYGCAPARPRWSPYAPPAPSENRCPWPAEQSFPEHLAYLRYAPPRVAVPDLAGSRQAPARDPPPPPPPTYASIAARGAPRSGPRVRISLPGMSPMNRERARPRLGEN